MPTHAATIEYFLADFPRTLFPLEVNRILVQHSADEIAQLVHTAITAKPDSAVSFLTQTRAYAAKPRFHLRRTLKLDAVAEFYLYDVIYRHRSSFRKSHTDYKVSFGYRFASGKMVSPAASYREFRRTVRKRVDEFTYAAKSDVAQYFNSIYHHDLVNWFRDHAKTEDDAELFGKFLREINGGRSIDCLPQGIFPAKVIGSQFLRVVEDSSEMRAAASLRFMDDIYLFDNDEGVLAKDFQALQRLLGGRGLTVNSAKTQFGRIEELDVKKEIDEIKRRLLSRRGFVILGSGADDDYWEKSDDEGLSEEEIDYLLDLLRDENLAEEDAELILAVMRDHTEDVLEHFSTILERFPSLSKNIYQFAKHVPDKASLLTLLRNFVLKAPIVTEYQLFWIAWICQDQLLKTAGIGDLLQALLDHSAATSITKGKVLEIPESRFGLADRREAQLRTGASSWLEWCSAAGSTAIAKAKRNHLLQYFAKSSWYNKLVADCVKKL